MLNLKVTSVTSFYTKSKNTKIMGGLKIAPGRSPGHVHSSLAYILGLLQTDIVRCKHRLQVFDNRTIINI